MSKKYTPDDPAYWEAILAAEGLGEIEKDGYLKVYHGTMLNNLDAVEMVARKEYFRKAQAYYHHCHRLSAEEKAVLRHHAEGLSLPEISEETGLKYHTVKKTVAQLRKKILKYRPRG